MAGCRVAMRARVICLVGVLLALVPITLSAQSRGFLSREQLDSLVKPENSAKAMGALELSHNTIELGDIDDSEEVYFNFELRNTTQNPITITEFRSSCGCVRVQTKPQTIEPNAVLRVGANFDPAGRSTEFHYRVNIYTDLDCEFPTERVMVTGRVVCDDEWLHLPEHAGTLRLSRKEVTINSRGEERIAVAKSGNKTITLAAKSTIEGLSLRCEPEVLMPNKEGNIYIEYTGHIPLDLTTILILEGVEASPTERVIKVTINR